MRLPNFFLVGAPRAGSTSVYGALAGHPDVYVSPLKEPHYFAAKTGRAAEVPSGPEQAPPSLDWEAYVALFAGATHERAVGEGSTSYLSSREAPVAISARFGDARILAVLRNPVDRLFSHYTWALGFGATREPFASWALAEDESDAELDASRGRVGAGRYATHLERYLECFPRERVHIFLFEDFVQDPSAVMAGIFRFLGVDPEVKVGLQGRKNETLVSRFPGLHRASEPARTFLRTILPAVAVQRARDWYHVRPKAVISPEDRAQVLRLYEDEVHRLEKILGRDLSSWRTR
jgi:hypothetical protein